MPRQIAFCLMALLGFCQAARGQDVTTEGAQQLRSTLERYLGRPQPGLPGSVTVGANGGSYRVTVDLEQVVRPFEQFGFTLDAPPFSFDTTPQSDGTWRVHNWQELGPATIVAGQQTVRYRWEGVEFDGTYDPAMGVFSRFDQTIERQFDEFRRPTEEGSTEYSKQVAHGTAVPASGGGADATVRLTYGPIMSRQKIMAPAAENQPPAPLFEFAYEVDSAAADVHFEGLRSRRILDLWAGTLEAVAGPGLAAEKPRWEALIREALPIFQKVEQSGSVQRLQVHTGIGDFELEQMAVRLATTGLVPEGSMSMSINASGFTFPTPVLPTWSVGLVPTAMDFNFGASGYDVESLVLQLVSQIQLDRTPMMTPQDWQTVLSRAACEGGVSLTLEPSRLTSPLFDIDVKGALAFNGPLPTGRFEVVARGLPQVMEALQEAQGNPAAGQALAKLSTAQAIGRPRPDGGTVWQIELLPTGKVLVNGWDLASPAQ